MKNELEILRKQISDQNPTDQQSNAIFAEELEFLLRAAPGSGKTWTSCRRFIWRGANWNYSAGGLALLSFTNAAIQEFKAATIKVGRRNLLSHPNYVGTFDAFVERYIISPFGHLIVGLTKRPKLFISPRPGDWNNKNLMAWTQSSRGGKMRVPAWEIIPFPDKSKIAFRATTKFGGAKLRFSGNNPIKELLSLGYYTHAQRIYWACRLLFERPHLADILAKRFPEIIVDEAQDTNIWLLILLNFLRERGSKITLIGDPDQCIYEFSMADATSLPALKEKWKISEKPLSRSFRCNDSIACAVKTIGGNKMFSGCGAEKNEYCLPFVIRELNTRFSTSVSAFQEALERANLDQKTSRILCRGHPQLESIQGEVNYNKLQGVAKEFTKAAFLRDCRKDYKQASQIVERTIRSIVGDWELWDRIEKKPDSNEALIVKLEIWRFVKSSDGLPPMSIEGEEWILNLRSNLNILLSKLSSETTPSLGRKITTRGLGSKQKTLPLFTEHAEFPKFQQDTIHQVKGQSIDGVLVLASSKFWNSVIKSINDNESTEDRRIAYVAMTRARHLLMIGLPAGHFDKHVSTWNQWGFNIL